MTIVLKTQGKLNEKSRLGRVVPLTVSNGLEEFALTMRSYEFTSEKIAGIDNIGVNLGATFSEAHINKSSSGEQVSFNSVSGARNYTLVVVAKKQTDRSRAIQNGDGYPAYVTLSSGDVESELVFTVTNDDDSDPGNAKVKIPASPTEYDILVCNFNDQAGEVSLSSLISGNKGVYAIPPGKTVESNNGRPFNVGVYGGAQSGEISMFGYWNRDLTELELGQLKIDIKSIMKSVGVSI